jgi:hypothetical protein
MNHELAEKIAGLASRINNLAVSHTDDDGSVLLALQDRLAQLTQAAIIADLSDEDASYQQALQGLNDAIDFIGEADGQIANVAKAISLASKAANLVDKAIAAVAKI